MGFTIKVEGLQEVLAKLGSFPEKIQKEIGGELKLAAEEVRRGAIQDAPVDRGKIKQSVTVDQSTGIAFTVTVESNYGPYQEWGTKSKKRIPAEVAAYAAHFQGPGPTTGIKMNDAILAWVKRKGIGVGRAGPGLRRRGQNKRDQNSQKGIAFVIARKIRKEGIKPHPFFFKHVFLVRDRLKQRIENIVKNLNAGR